MAAFFKAEAFNNIKQEIHADHFNNRSNSISDFSNTFSGVSFQRSVEKTSQAPGGLNTTKSN